MHENSHEVVNKLWDDNQSTDVVIALNKGEAAQRVIDSQPRTELIYSPEEIQCSDGRCPHKGNEISLAGSGILMPRADLIKMIKEKKIKKITMHFDCGAARIAFADAQANGLVPEGITNADEFGRDWGQKLATELGLEYEYIEAEKFVAPDHHEQGIFIDATGKLHPAMFENLPNVFITQSASCASPDYVAVEAAALTKIGFGDHGLGERLKSEAPFQIMIGCESNEQAALLGPKIKEAVQDYGDRAQVHTFIAPA